MADRQRRVRRVVLAGGLGTVLLLGGGATASAQEAPASCYADGTERCAQVGDAIIGRDTGAVAASPAVLAAPAAAAAPRAQVAGRTAQLPVTGGDVAGLGMVGGALLVGGAAIVTASRRRQSATL